MRVSVLIHQVQYEKITLNQLVSKVTNQKKENIQSKDWIIVLSSAIQESNEELIQAKKLNCKIIKRGELLAEIIHGYQQIISVVGTHGKTTTSSLLVENFSQLMNPSYFVGGHLDNRPHANAN